MTCRALLAALIVMASAPSLGDELRGHVSRVRDGDTLVVDGHPVRLCGIDTPERGKPGATRATRELRHVAPIGARIRCIPVGSGTPCDGRSERQSRDRIVAQCFVGKMDLARHMVAKGGACDWPAFSGGAYAVRGGCVRR